ncbi:MAG TPA: CHAP domain-containing protein [Streptosporangiaceae bacterium]|nr:CHAP domain-containing protein [Streptosporangiaceae bacterium]
MRQAAHHTPHTFTLPRAAAIPTPDQCRQNAGSTGRYGWRPNHFAYCQVTSLGGRYYLSDGTLAATFQLRLTIIGQGSYDPTSGTQTDQRSATLTAYVDQVQLDSGTLPPGNEQTIGFACTGDPAGSCQTTSAPVSHPVLGWNGQSVSFTYTSPNGVGITTGGTRNVAFADGTFNFTIVGGCPACLPGTPYSGPTGMLRFDGPGSSIMTVQLGATFQPVDSGDTQPVDALQFQYNGSYNGTSYAQAAQHYYVALNFPNSTYPLTGGKRIPTVLTRMSDSVLADLGRSRVARPLCRSVWGDDYATRYGPNMQCDEFPFAATYQGSPTTATGAPDGTQISVCPISASANGAAGNLEQSFFQQERIFDEVDPFAVTVTNVPSPAPGPAALPCPTPDPNAPGVGRLVFDVAAGGAFVDEWDAMNDQLGPLGDPTGNYSTVAGGERQLFTGGGIYWSAATGTHEVHGAIYGDYSGLGGPGSGLGFPTSDQRSAPGSGQENLFAGTSCGSGPDQGSGSAILWSSSTPASEVQGCIYQAYLQAYGGPPGTLGYPTSNERPMASGRASYFAGTSCGSSTGSAIYWDGAAHAVYGCIFQKYKSLGEANSSLGFPVDDEHAYNGGRAQDFQHGWVTYINGVTTVNNWVVGHAAHAGDDYPYETIGQFGHQNEGTDAWNEYYGQCDSFAAWKVYENIAGSAAQHPPIVPAPGWTPSNASISPVNQFTWGNADIWASKWKALGYAVDTVPSPGAIAYWPNATTDPQDGNPPDPVNGLGEFGHVAYVTDVYADGSITVEGYNMRENGEYSVVHMDFGTGYTDNSFGQPGFSVPWPKYFIHVHDGPSGAASPPEPGPGVVQAGYPTQVTVIGPGSPSSQFSTANVWYTDGGHGEAGTEVWTHTNGPTAVSAATWTPSGLAASICYRVDAFVPDNYSDNPVAVYTVSDATGTSYAAVNENVQTNDWSELGVFKTNGSGTGLSVRLDDRGVTGLYVAADAMRFWKQASCSGEGDVSSVFMPSSYVGTWLVQSGHGFFGSEHYAGTTGSSSSDHSASWTPSHLVPYGCYDISLYVPDNYSDNPGALYFTNDTNYGVFYPQVDENAYTNQFAWIGTFQAYGDGTLPAELFNTGPKNDYVAADAIAYVLNPHCMAENGGTNAFGSAYTSSVIGPGSGPPGFTTTSDWYLQAGHGYANHELWTHTNGATPVSTATWLFYGTANACYTASAYIPNNYADNPSAAYTISTQAGSTATSINQANSTGWTQFQGNPKITTGSNGQVTVALNDTGPTGTYTAADAISFIRTGC